MSKRTRQYIGILAALAAYYLVHEGAHLLYALLSGVFKQINFMGLGVQIDVYAEHMTNMAAWNPFALWVRWRLSASDTCWRHLQGASAMPKASCFVQCFTT